VRACTRQELLELFERKEISLLPTAPLHSEGYEVNVEGYPSPWLVMGWRVKHNTPFVKKLFRHYILHRLCRKSRLNEIVDDVPGFMEAVEDQEFESESYFDFLRELEQPRETNLTTKEVMGILRNKVDKKEIEFWTATVFYCFLHQKGIPAVLFHERSISQEDEDREGEDTARNPRVIIGQSVLPVGVYFSRERLCERLEAIETKLKALKIPEGVETEEIRIFIDGEKDKGTFTNY
jgi:hypothetical protein